MKDKKDRERFLLEGFAIVCPDFPPGRIENTESPDFLVSDSSQVIGIEIVDYVRGQDSEGSAYRRNEVLLQTIALRARREYESLYSDPLMVHFTGYPGQQLPKIRVPDLAADAATTVRRFVPETLFKSVRVDSDQFTGALLQAVVSSIRVTRVRNARQASWSPVGAGFVSASVNEIRDLIASKDTKAPAYLQQCDEVWLLIVADGTNISSTLDLSEEIRQARFPSRFKRVFFYDYQDKRAIPLCT
jgi:hypothetical protein